MVARLLLHYTGRLFALAALFGLASAWLLRGGVTLRIFDIAVVTTDGKRVSRLRAAWRGLIAWSPVILAVSLAPFPISVYGVPFSLAREVGWAICAWLIFFAAAAFAIVCPQRGLQDRIAGTHLVPR
jgi:hypothetical protein